MRISFSFSGRLPAYLLLFILLASCVTPDNLAPPQVELQASVPSSFTDALVANVPLPTALAATPDGRLLITSQSGQLRVYQNGALRSTPALDLRSKICANRERGLVGVAVDLDFAANGYIYLFYTFDKAGTKLCDRSTNGTSVHRLSRFTLSGNTASLSSERVLIDNIPVTLGAHTAGDLHFGKDGLLYISVGDGACDYRGDSGCSLDNDAARDPHVLLGKILRITKTGAIPSTNPYRGTNSTRCNTTGKTSPGKVCQEIYATGLRNPFRLAFDPNASGTRFFINDVGQNVWEEVNLGRAGADYGWNLREGPCKSDSSSDCGTVSGLTNPSFSYKHQASGTFAGCASITGGVFVPNGLWPGFNGAYLFGDYVCGKIFKLVPSGSSYSASVLATGLGSSSAVHLAFGPYGKSQALYYTTYAGGGQVRRISYSGTSNAAPQVVASATPTYGAAPLTVSFSASGSRDPEGGVLSYRWSFGDGSTATGGTATHTYKINGSYTATLTARDPQGAEGTATVRLSVGNTPPTPSITGPSADARFGVGEAITLRGTATDAEDGAVPTTQLSWTALLHHNSSHTHPLDSGTGGSFTVAMPAPEDLAATQASYLEVRLTATDKGGLSRTVSRNLYPAKVNATFQTAPSGLKLEVNGVSFTAPKTFVSWRGYKLNVKAATQTTSTGATASFRSWSDGGAAAHTVTTPASATTYTASFAVSP